MIIALLAAPLTPALALAKAKARPATCLSNLRRFGIAMQLQLSAEEDRFVDRRDLENGPGLQAVVDVADFQPARHPQPLGENPLHRGQRPANPESAETGQQRQSNSPQGGR